MRQSLFVRRLSVFTFTSSLITATAVSAASVTGRVVDPESRPVPNAAVIVVCGQRITTSAVTDAEGRFQTGDAEGRCELRVAVQGFAAKPATLDLPADSSSVDAGTVTTRRERHFRIGRRLCGAGRHPTVSGVIVDHGHHRG